ncbi:hypothetical protein SVAN01_06407 [Stagonosporopsis vannaccii]|nr:hypothetical protein SVAN01_06407 [Stagonosporopsis vannaccii]
MACLSTEQRDTISDFIEATKEPVSVAIRTLQETEWDLLDAISQFGDDAEEDDDTVEPVAPVIESIRPRSIPDPGQRSRTTDKASLRFLALHNSTRKNGIEFPRSQKSVLLNPISINHSLLPTNTPSAPMFNSPYDEKERFKDEVLNQWVNERYTDAFDELQGTHASDCVYNRKIMIQRDNAELFESDFEDDVVLPVQAVMGMLLSTKHFQKRTRTRVCNLADAEDEDIATEDCVWAPRYVIRFANFGERSETRLIGHVEFLAGRPGALSKAYNIRQTAKWASLRCVLGDIVQWMLMNNHRYSFLVSSDEIMFLRMHINEVKFEDKKSGLDPKTVLYEPWLYYSKPMKITDTFNAKEGTITVRMGLFHLFFLAIHNDKMWRLPDEMGNCLNYATFTGDEEDLKLRPPTVPVPLGGK